MAAISAERKVVELVDMSLARDVTTVHLPKHGLLSVMAPASGVNDPFDDRAYCTSSRCP